MPTNIVAEPADPSTTSRNAIERRLQRFIDRVPAGGRRVAVVRGPKGSGRSTLLRSVADYARQDDFVVVSIEGFTTSVDHRASRRLANELPIDGGGAFSEPRRALRFELDRLAASGRRVLLLVDDFERLGADDLALIQEVAVHPPDGPTAVLISASDQTPRHGLLVTRVLDQVRSLPHTEWFELHALTRDEMQELLRTHEILEAATETFIDDLHYLTGGNLRYATAWLDMLANAPHAQRLRLLSGSQPLEAAAPPEALAELIVAEVSELAGSGVALVRALAIWGRPALMSDLAQLTGSPQVELELTLEEIAECGLAAVADGDRGLRAWLTDPTIAHVVRHHMPLPTSRRLHRAAATMVEPELLDGADTVAAAEHYVASGEPLDEVRIAVLVRAARWLNGTSRYAQSYSLLASVVGTEAAPRVAASVEVPREAYSLLAEALARFGAWRDARELVEAVGALSRSGDDRAALLTRAARDHVSRGSDAQAMRVYRMLLDDPDLTPLMRARVAEDAGRVIDLLGQHQEARDLARSAAEDAEQLGDLGLAADIWISYHALLFYAADIRESLDIALHALRLARRARNGRSLGRALMAIGNCLGDERVDRSIRWLRRGMQVAQAAGDSASVAWVSVRLAEAYEDAGDWPAARAAGRNAVHMDLALHRIRAANRSRATLAILEARHGNLAESSLLMDLVQGRDEEGIDDVRGVSVAIAGYEHAVASGDWERALAQVRLARARLHPSSGRRRTLLVEILPREVHAAAQVGDVAGVESASRTFEEMTAELHGTPTRLFSALRHSVRADLLAAQGDLIGAIEEAATAAGIYGKTGHRWRRGLALMREGELRSRLGRDEDPVALNEAFLEFRAIGATVQLEAARTALRAIGKRAPRASQARQGALTRREWQILRAAAAGKRDAEIGAELWISPRTVSTHMHNLLKKLGLRSRHELTGWMAHQEAAGAADAWDR